MKVGDIAKVTGGVLKGPGDIPVRRVCSDSRKVEGGDLFVALRGERFDGHDFIGEAFEKGAVCAISEKERDPPKGKALVVVKNSLEALRSIALWRRGSFRGAVIGIAGSVGKTTTKELTAHLLSEVGPTFKNYGNLNSQIGVPLVLSNLPEDALYAVVEMGASSLGEISKLVEIVKPSVRVITAIGEEHLEGFGDMKGVIEGNGEIFEGFSKECWAVLPFYALKYYKLPRERVVTFGEGGDLNASEVRLTQKGTEFKFMGERFRVPVLSLGIVDNVLSAFGVLKVLGHDPREFREALSSFKGVEGRMRLFDFGDFTVIDDTYNANPPSVKNALLTLSKLKTDSKKIAVLGDMLELGPFSERLHKEIGAFSAKLPIDLVMFYGKEMLFAHEERRRRGKASLYFSSKEDLVEALLKWTKDKNIILLKGSRGMRMEEVLNRLRETKGYER